MPKQREALLQLLPAQVWEPWRGAQERCGHPMPSWRLVLLLWPRRQHTSPSRARHRPCASCGLQLSRNCHQPSMFQGTGNTQDMLPPSGVTKSPSHPYSSNRILERDSNIRQLYELKDPAVSGKKASCDKVESVWRPSVPRKGYPAGGRDVNGHLTGNLFGNAD